MAHRVFQFLSVPVAINNREFLTACSWDIFWRCRQPQHAWLFHAQMNALRPVISKTILLLVRIISMTRSKRVGNFRISLVERWSVFSINKPIGVLSFYLQTHLIEFLPHQLRAVAWVCLEVPGFLRSRSSCKSASVNANPGGQPSTIQPMAGPWLSPNEVTVNSFSYCVSRHINLKPL